MGRARFFAAVLDLLREPGRAVTILTATSGDTGAAVARAFWRRPGVRVVRLEPRRPRHDVLLNGEAIRRRFEELFETRDLEELPEPEAA